MDDRLKEAYLEVLSKHYMFVRFDAVLPWTDKMVMQFRDDYLTANAKFIALLKLCKLPIVLDKDAGV